MGYSPHTQNIQINIVTGENEKRVLYFMEKKKTFLANTVTAKVAGYVIAIKFSIHIGHPRGLLMK